MDEPIVTKNTRLVDRDDADNEYRVQNAYRSVNQGMRCDR
jgi:hypothetical protein